MKRMILWAAAAILAGMAHTPHAAAQSGAPAPESVLGFAPCSDYRLATYEQIADYFRKLDAATDRMQLFEIGKTAEGRVQLMAVISSEQNMKNLARYKEIARSLAQARDLTDERARALAREGKAVIWIDFGLHSTEVAHGQTAPLMAYKAVTDESDEMRFIRDNVVFLLVPNMNPDGTTLVADWYMKHVGTPFELSSPPELYQKYVGHDNNRDWFMFNQPESKNIARQLYDEWFPQIIYNQHQTAPFPARIFVPPFDDPMNPKIPPLVMRGVNAVGEAMTRRLDQEGKRGAISRDRFDTWWNGGMRTAPYFHNMVGILTETGHASATPANYDPKKFPKTFPSGIPTLEPTTYYPSPYLGGEWHLRDSCDIMVTASMAVLDIGAKRRQEWLYDIYQMGRDSIEAGEKETYVISADQWDPGTAVKLVNVLRTGGVEVERATAAFSAGNKSYPAGSFFIRGNQAFRPYFDELLNPQQYPDMRLYPGGPPKQPYDITGWTLNYQMGVEVDRLGEAVRTASEKVGRASVPKGSVTGTGGAYVLDPRANDSFVAANRLMKAGDEVYRAIRPLHAAGIDLPAGAFLVKSGSGTAARIDQAAQSLGLQIRSIERPPSGELIRVKSPRVGLYHAWGGNMDEGWTRWILEQFEFPYSSLYDRDVRAGGLRTRYDLIILPDSSYEEMRDGLASGTMPPEYTGGLTPKGVANLYDFVAQGGTLVALDSAAELPLTAFSVPVTDVTANLRSSEFYIPGTLLNLEVDNTHPLAYGIPPKVAAFFTRSPAFSVGRGANRAEQERGQAPPKPKDATVVAHYPPKDVLKSGWLLGERIIANRAAVVEIAVEKGRVVLIGFRSQHRGQPHATFKFLFNSILGTGAEKVDSF